MKSADAATQRLGAAPGPVEGGVGSPATGRSDCVDSCAPGEEDVRDSLSAHVAERGNEIFRKYGPRVGWSELLRLLEDRAFVRYPCRIVFDAGKLEPGEFAYPVPLGEQPDDGFAIHVHPVYATQLDAVPALVLYQLVVINYAGFASADDAEALGAAAMGMSRGEYYATVCRLADQVQGADAGSCR